MVAARRNLIEHESNRHRTSRDSNPPLSGSNVPHMVSLTCL
nr:MAG TPA: hypothetical protein [Caudoviricetes sp.]